MAAIDTSTGNVKDLKEVKDTLYSISERLKYYFKNLSLEDNFEADMYLSFQQDDKNMSALEIKADGLSSDYLDLKNETASKLALLDSGITAAVSKGDLVNQINLEPDTLRISGNRLILSGSNISLDENNNLSVSGNITATSGKIAGWDISGRYMNGGSAAKIKCKSFSNANEIYLDRIYVSGTPGSTNLSFCNIAGGGAYIYMNDSTTWNDEFTMGHAIVGGDVRCGILIGADRINVTGTVYAPNGCYSKKSGSTYSDRELKEGIAELNSSDTKLMVDSLKPVRFRWKDSKAADVGFIAQDVLEIEGQMEGRYDLVEEMDGYLTLDYIGVMIFLLNKLNEQTVKIDELTA